MQVRYLQPATYDDELEIVTSVAARGRASITLDYAVSLVGGGPVASGHTKLACVGRGGKIRRLPPEL